MVKRSRIELQAGNIGDSVALPVPMMYRGVDPRNIIDIIDKNENDLYTIATVDMVSCPMNTHTRADFTLCSQQLLKDSDINNDKHLSLREALKSVKCTTSERQRFVKM